MKKYFPLFILLGLAACGGPAPEAQQQGQEQHHQHAAGAKAGYADSVNAGLIAEDTYKKSVIRTTMATFGGVHIHLVYGSPGVRGRVIWGGLVPYNEVWAAGAHEATRISFSRAVRIKDQEIPAGTYGFFAIPGPEKWTLILNTRYQQHLADEYQSSEDVVRVEVSPQTREFTPRLTYGLEKTGPQAGLIHLDWEKLRLSLPIKLQ